MFDCRGPSEVVELKELIGLSPTVFVRYVKICLFLETCYNIRELRLCENLVSFPNN